MHIAFQAIIGIEVHGTDGILGTIRDLLFERDTLQIRYLDIAAVRFYGSRRVLLAPESVQSSDWPRGVVNVYLNHQQVAASPEIDEHQPLPRQKELELVRHFGWQPYWSTGPVGVADAVGMPAEATPVHLHGQDANLWNAQELLHYGARTRAGDIGYVEDLIIDDAAWKIEAFVVDLENWITGRRVLVSAQDVATMDWEARSVQLSKERREIEKCPRFQPGRAVNRDERDRCFDYYGRERRENRSPAHHS